MGKGDIVMGQVGDGTYWWKLTDQDAEVGDFAIVENLDSFCLIEVMVVAETDARYEKKLAHHSGGIYKKVRYVIPRVLLTKE